MRRAAHGLFVVAVLFLGALTPAGARAAEAINRYDVAIAVERDGDIVVAETITVTAEGDQIRRGIFRDLPRYFEVAGDRLAYDYDVLEVMRDGRREPYDSSVTGNARRLRIGDPDVFLDHGRHTYVIRYRVKNQVRYFDAYDEVYWNATGTYWAFPIEEARATITFPEGARTVSAHAYTGRFGARGTDYSYREEGARHVFETTRRLNAREGLTVAVAVEKGLIDPPSATDKTALWWARNGALVILFGSLAGLFAFLYRSFERVGRDPAKGPVFPRYAPPEGYAPSAVHHIYYRGTRGHKALIATLMKLAVDGRLTIDASQKRETTLARVAGARWPADLGDIESALERKLFAAGDEKTFGKKYDSAFIKAYLAFQKDLARDYGHPYFRWNVGYTLAAVILSVIAVVVAANQAIAWTGWHTIGVLALAGLNLAFMYFMPAPTPKGQEVRTAIEGFRLYLETAEKLQLNAVEPGSEAPPPMTKERYERFLPYAVALGVEQPWTRHFERLLPQEAEGYRPAGVYTGSRAFDSLHGLNSALVATMNSGVNSAMPQSSSSSGAGGGGSSGGGGGGGGGGGW